LLDYSCAKLRTITASGEWADRKIPYYPPGLAPEQQVPVRARRLLALRTASLSEPAPVKQESDRAQRTMLWPGQLLAPPQVTSRQVVRLKALLVLAQGPQLALQSFSSLMS
jgi:hypothetical protein